MTVVAGRWAMLPTWLFFVILGNSSSGGAVSPPLLPSAFAFISQWLPSGATVTALRDAIYFRGHQHVHPIAVLTIWAAALFIAWLVVARRRESSATAPSAVP
jgi:ABC-type multidrug transport system permease subunit